MNEPWLLLVLGGLLGILLAALAVLFMQVRRLPVEQQQQEARLQARLERWGTRRRTATEQTGAAPSSIHQLRTKPRSTVQHRVMRPLPRLRLETRRARS